MWRSSSGAVSERLSPAWSAESIAPILWSPELRNIWVYAFWTETSVQMDNYSDYLLLWSPRDKKLWYLDIEHEEFHPLAKWDDFIADPGRYLNGMIEGEFEE